jgi:hypothetical protein
MADVDKGYNGYIPPRAFTALSWEAAKIVHGTATLTLHIRNGKLVRFVTNHEQSFMDNTDEQPEL